MGACWLTNGSLSISICRTSGDDWYDRVWENSEETGEYWVPSNCSCLMDPILKFDMSAKFPLGMVAGSKPFEDCIVPLRGRPGMGAESNPFEDCIVPLRGRLGMEFNSDCFLISSNTPLARWLRLGLIVSSMDVS
jgi:hypothetical protein